jgi:hypothetical protein
MSLTIDQKSLTPDHTRSKSSVFDRKRRYVQMCTGGYVYAYVYIYIYVRLDQKSRTLDQRALYLIERAPLIQMCCCYVRLDQKSRTFDQKSRTLDQKSPIFDSKSPLDSNVQGGYVYIYTSDLITRAVHLIKRAVY